MFNLFNTDDFVARRVCGAWTDTDVLIHVASNLIIALSYLSIPAALAYILYKRKDAPFRFIWLMFIVFIVSCGATHIMDATMFYWPAYRLTGVFLSICAVASASTVAMLWRHMGTILRLPDARVVAEQEHELNKQARILDMTHAAILVRDRTNRIIFWNQGAVDTYGYTAEEAIGQEVDKFLQTSVSGGGGKPLPDSCPDHWEGQLAHIKKDGRRIIVHSRWAKYNNNVIECNLDITSKHEAEEQLRHYNEALENKVGERTQELSRVNSQLREAGRQKDQFLAMLSHELRNPLSPILNALALMRSSNHDERTLQYQEIIERQAKHLSRIVDDLLDVSRINQGKINLRMEVIDMNLVCARAAQSVRPMMDARVHAFETSVPKTPCWVEVDSTRMDQVVVNLLTNAAKYTDPGGRVRMSVLCEGEMVIIRVIDNGSGIKADILHHLFEPFVQSERTLDRSQGGLGLGLCLVRRLVEMHGGSVTAKSEGAGCGSEFFVRIPITEKKPPVRAERLREGTRVSRKILVVDDNVDAADSLRMLLELQGHEVRVAYDGEAAIASATADEPEIVLLDIGLPKIDGYNVAKALRRQKTLQKITLVAMTGYGHQEDKDKASEAGFDMHMTKPVEPEILNRILRDLEEEAP